MQSAAVLDYSRALPQRDRYGGLARNGCPVGRLRHREILYPSDMLDDVVACGVPDIDAEGEFLVSMGQVRLHSSWPAGIYTRKTSPRNRGSRKASGGG